MATLLSVLQDACDFGGFPRPTSIINNSDATTRQLLAIANERGIEAVRMFDWPQLTKLSSLSLVAGVNQTLPADCAELLDSTAWFTGDMSPLRGPITTQQWQYLTQTSSAGLKFAFRVTQNGNGSRAIAMHPTPAGTETISLFYRSKTWIRPRLWEASMSVTAGMWVFSDSEYWTANTSGTAGTTAPTIANNGADGTITWTRKPNVLYERFVADTDEPLIESSLLMKGILARFYRMKGLEYQDLEAEFNVGLRNDLAERNGGRTSNMFRHRCGFIDTECRDVGFIGGSTSGTNGGGQVITPFGGAYGMGSSVGYRFPSAGTQYFPTPSTASPNEWADIMLGYRKTFFIKQDRTLWAMGRYIPIPSAPEFSNLTQIGTNTWKCVNDSAYFGLGWGAGITEAGELYGWGSSSSQNGSLGGLPYGSYAIPSKVGTDTDWVDIRTNQLSSFALKTNGSIWRWGPDIIDSPQVPTPIGSQFDWAKIRIGVDHFLAIKANGTLWARGYNGNGQLGVGNTNNSSNFIQVGTANNWVDAYCGNQFSIAIKADGTLWAWGRNDIGQCGVGQGLGTVLNGFLSFTTPQQVGTSTDWVKLARPGYTNEGYMDRTLAIKKDNSLWSWGKEYGGGGQGSLGTGNATEYVPVKIWNSKVFAAGTYGYHSVFLVEA